MFAKKMSNKCAPTNHQNNSCTCIARIKLRNILIQWPHHVEIDSRTESCKGKLQPKDHIQFFTFKPRHGISVLGHC